MKSVRAHVVIFNIYKKKGAGEETMKIEKFENKS